MIQVLLVLIVIGLAVIFPKFGKTLLIIAGALVVLFVVIYLFYQGKEEIAKTRIAANEIVFDGLRLKPGYSSSYEIVGRIRNKSRYKLTSIQLKVLFKDCQPDGNCETIAEQNVSLYQDVPAGQARDFDESIYLSHANSIRGQIQWSYTISEIKGE
jgi:hypothetical protein